MGQTTNDLLLDRLDDGVVLLTLNRPDSLNAITMAMQSDLDEAIGELETEDDVRAVVITGAGERAFSAGYDLHEMADWSADELLLCLIKRERWLWHLVETRLPIVAALNGLSFGAGAIISAGVDLRVGCPETKVRFTAASYGGANATWCLPPLVGSGRAAELLLTARVLEAVEAEQIGFLNALVAQKDVVSCAVRMASAVAANPPEGTQAIKRLMREHRGRDTQDRFEAENLVMRTDLRPRPISEVYESNASSPFRPRNGKRS
ncbi:enoyl-CoA hydratase/isomerase family protein [Patulibacter minatonensis]|uniref:enoyl-CoA hydratase/isomerase family protein n=1 Tax=Patulibacter minatonensis TaxID=298163 RepID=UPI000684D356|nr:enoyl-CoA hydratase/isomerase family protein [Patulibacter minatonensis]